MKKEKKLSEEEEFAKYLEKIEDPKDEREINRSLPKNPNSLQIAKYKLCKKILSYQINNNLSDEELINKLDLSRAETEDILFCEIEKFTLDRLTTYADKLFSPSYAEMHIDWKTTQENQRI